MDAVDGILLEKIPKNLKNASKEEIETYEEERRLFYVGVTRAENQLVVFTIEGLDVDEKNVQIQFGAERKIIQLKMVAANGILEVVK